MASIDTGPRSGALITRIKNIIFTPEAEWTVIEAEPATVKGLYQNYACILAAIGPVAQLIGSQVFGYHALWISYRPSIVSSVVGAIVSYLLALAGVYVLALIIDALAPSFGGTKSQIQAFKVAVYASTASWVAGVFQLVPMVSALAIIGIYSLYLLYLGLPKLMKAPADKALVYTIVTIVCAVVIFAVIGAVTGAVIAAAGGGVAGGALSVS